MKVTLPGGIVKNGAGSSISAQVAATTWALLKTKYPTYTQDQIINLLTQTSTPIRGSKGQAGKLINTNGALSAVLAPSPVVVDKSAIIAEANKAIALAEAQYQAELKAAADKLAAIKAEWAKKING